MDTNIISFAGWKVQTTEAAKAAGFLPFLSYDTYKAETGAKEYQCVLLSPEHKLFHLPQTPLFESDCLAEACFFVSQYFKEHGVEVAVWQDRSQGYRDYYQITTKHSKRDSSGRFIKEI
jgi:hypothetical protein